MQIFEDTDRQDDLSMETFYVLYLNIDDIETKDYHVSSAEHNGEMVDKSDAESHDPNEEMIIQTRSREKGRPTLLRTGKPSGPRTVYQPSATSRQTPYEILVRGDVEL